MAFADRIWWRRCSRYLNSQGWQLTREACLKRDGYRCRRCGLQGSARNPLQADYLTDENFNGKDRTPLSDLQTLCRPCHELTTGRRFRGFTFGQSVGRIWRRLTLRQKAVLILGAWLALVLLRNVLMPIGQLRPVSAVTPGASSTLTIPSRTAIHNAAIHHGRHVARKAGPSMPPPG